MRKIIAITAASVAAGLGAGLVAVAGGGDAGASARDKWREPRLPDADPPASAEALIASGHFPPLAAEETSGEDAAEPAAPEMPKAISVQILNGRLIVTVKLSTGAMRSASVGDAFDGGWRLSDATMQAVVWEKNGETREQRLFGY